MRRGCFFVMVVLGLLALTAVPAEAAREEGRIQVRQEEGEQLLLYPVGKKSGSDFVLGKLYGGGLVRGADIHRPELARWLAEAAQGGLQPVSKDDNSRCHGNKFESEKYSRYRRR